MSNKFIDKETGKVSPSRAGLFSRCPACGEGKLFRSYLKVVDHCSVCGHEWASEDSGDGPAVFIISLVGFIVMFAALGVEVKFEPPLWVHAVLWTPLLLGLSLGLLQPLKGWMIGQAHKHRAGEARLKDEQDDTNG